MSIIYFDNAATTYKKPKEAIQKTLQFIRRGYGNPGRSGHSLSIKAAEIIYDTREAIADLLHYHKPENVVFYKNATEALNVAIKTCIPKGSHVLTSLMEHNSVLRPLYSMEQDGLITLSFFSHKGNIEENIKNLIKDDTKAIVCSLVSNVTGEEIDLSVLSKIKKEKQLILIVDASQMFAHKNIDLAQHEVDVLCTAGHKGAFGMQGVGFAVYNLNPKRTYIEGGSGVLSFSHEMPHSLPERMEAGTLSTPAIASLYYGLEYIRKIGIENIEQRLYSLDTLLVQELRTIKGLKMLSEGHHGIHSFILNEERSSVTANKLENYNIFVRSGFHCAPLIHQFYQTEETGAVRVSLSILNKEYEIYRLIKVLKKIKA